MSLINLEDLLRPVAADAPSGPNLEYDPEFMSLERTARGKPEQRMGSAIVAGEPPDYRLVLERGVALFGRTKDLRVAVHVVQAVLQRGGLEGLHDGLALVRGLLEDFWQTLHPELDPDDGNDPTMRITALLSLGNPGLLADVRALPLVRASGLGILALKDLQRPGAGSKAPDSAAMDALFLGADPAALAATATWLQQSSAHLAAIDVVFESRTGARGPDLGPLLQSLQEAYQVLAPRLVQEPGPPLETQASEAGRGSAKSPRGPAVAGEVSSREDVVRVLEQLCEYYARYEPSSPLPLLLQRCKRLVPMTFLEIVRELAPDGVGQIEVVAGKVNES